MTPPVKDASAEARKAVAVARTGLLFEHGAFACFFGALAMRLEPREDTTIPTAATDSRFLYYNPEFFLGLSPADRKFVVCHEVAHVAFLHFSRLRNRDLKRFNMAADLAVNCVLEDGGLTVPDLALLPGKTPFGLFPRGLSAEEYYELVKPSQVQACAGPDGDPGGCGSITEPGSEKGRGPESPEPGGYVPSAEEQAAVWAKAVEQAQSTALRRGSLPDSLSRLVSAALAPVVPWTSVLRDFVSSYARNDFSWGRPNRRFLGLGLYLPGLRSEELGRVVCCVDTSGSIGASQLDRFAAELQGVLDAYDCELEILYHDVEVAGRQSWASSDGPLRLEAKGGGGTSHFAVLAEAERLDPAVVLCFTDCYSSYPADFGCPLLWCVVNNANPERFAPEYGRVLKVEA